VSRRSSATTFGSVVYTGGTFDLWHPGHVYLLEQCRSLAGRDGRVVVALNTDEFVGAYKRIIPTHDYAERRAILEACRFVDLVVRNTGGADSKVAIEVVDPDIIAIGSDWKGRDYYAQMGFTPDWLAERRIELQYLQLLTGHSSTRIRRELAGAL
jgi:glycerol-3-phosphate cytidylyltransferase